MESFLKEISSTTQSLFDFRDFHEYEKRLKTFADWPFKQNCKCTPENMASAGFIYCPNANEPDVAKCFFCLIELEGWEPDHNPWLEHSKRSKDSCGFLTLSKSIDDLTMEEYYELEMERVRIFLMCKLWNLVNLTLEQCYSTLVPAIPHCIVHLLEETGNDSITNFFQIERPDTMQQILCKTGRSIINAFEKEVAETRKRLVDTFVNKYQYSPETEKPAQTFLQCCPPSAKANSVPTIRPEERILD